MSWPGAAHETTRESDGDLPLSDAGARRASALLGARIDEIVENFLAELADVDQAKPWLMPETLEPARENARRDIGREVAAVQAGGLLPEQCPEEVRTSAGLAVAYGIPLGLALQCYRIGHRVQWTAWQAAVRGLGLPPDAERDLLDRGSGFFFAYADRCSWWMEAEYTAARDRRLRGTEQRRMRVITELLAGRSTSEPDALGYELAGEHLAVVATGETARGSLDELGAHLRAPVLAVDVDPVTAWGWVRLTQPDALRALRSFTPPDGARLAVGGPAPGAEGFRRAHEEAAAAEGIGRHRAAPVTLYDDVALEALADRDRGAASDFVTRELGSLAQPDARSNLLRRTLRAYFAVGQQASSAAALLGVHERTVANRLRAAEAILGRPVGTRHTELDTALRLHDLMD